MRVVDCQSVPSCTIICHEMVQVSQECNAPSGAILQRSQFDRVHRTDSMVDGGRSLVIWVPAPAFARLNYNGNPGG